jgi:hypothetical protein
MAEALVTQRLVLELGIEDGLPAGRVKGPDGRAHPFRGWLELMSAIAAAAGIDRARSRR